MVPLKRKVGKIPKNKSAATPADGDPIATSATSFAGLPPRPHAPAGPHASTSTSTEPIDISQFPDDEITPASRPAPTPIARPSGSRDDIKRMRLRHCAIGFKDLGISGSDRYWMELTRDFKKLSVVADRSETCEQLLELNISKGNVGSAMAVHGEEVRAGGMHPPRFSP